MNAATTPFRLLIINESQEEAKRLISMFHNAGRPCRAHHATSEQAFKKIIEEQRWDLAIAHSDTQSPTPTNAIRIIKKYNFDIPVIFLTEGKDERSVVDGLKLGAADVVQLDDDQHLLLVVERELNNREFRKNTRIAERKLKEIERRNQQLLDSSKDGIAFIQDGTFIYSNDSFAECCGRKKSDDIEYEPILDMVAENDQEKVRTTLKNFFIQHDKLQNEHLSFEVKAPDGGTKKLDVELMIGEFDEESCIQFLINAKISDSEMLEAELESIKTTDNATGLNNKSSFQLALDNFAAKASEDESTYSLLYIDIDQFEQKVESTVGLDGADLTLAEIAKLLSAQFTPEDHLARLGDHAFGAISHEHNLEKLMHTGEAICASIREHLFDIKTKTIRLTASIGITLINENTIDSQAAIKQATKAIENLRTRKKSDSGDAVNLFQAESDDKNVLVSSLQKAISEKRFKLLFQPVISLRGDETERYEVLLRMVDENGDEISPNNFLQATESMQANTKIDRWVLLETIKHLSNYNNKAGQAQLIVNISHHTLCDDSLLPWLKVAFQAAKIDPKSLMLQAQEKDINDHLVTAKRFIDEASSVGISFCISHFGCALEPIALLDQIDVEYIKIDGSFSLEIQVNPANSEAIEILLNSLKEKGKTIIVPMVENASILSSLWKMGVQCIQGNYLQPPGEAMDYEFSVEDSA